eukprot:5751978-Amphidinium_carterae.1
MSLRGFCRLDDSVEFALKRCGVEAPNWPPIAQLGNAPGSNLPARGVIGTAVREERRAPEVVT